MFNSIITVGEVKKLSNDRIENLLEFYQDYINSIVDDFNKRIVQVYKSEYDCFDVGGVNLSVSNINPNIPQHDKLIIANKLSELLSQSGWKLVKYNFSESSYKLEIAILPDPIINETELDLK